MARNNRDVELVIRGKNEASKPISAVTSDLKGLKEAQDSAGKSAERAGGLLSKFSTEARTLRDNLESLRQIEKTGNQIDRMAQSVQKAQADLANLNQQAATVAADQQRLAAAAQTTKAALDAQSASTVAAASNLKKVDTELERASARYKTLYTEVKKTKAPSDELKNALRQQRDIVVSLTMAQEKAVSQLSKETAAEKELSSAASVANNALKNSERNQEDLAATIAKTNANIEQQIAKMRELQAATVRKTSTDPVTPMSVMSGYGAQVKAVSDAQRAYGQARAEVARLKNEMASAAAPTTEMAQALELAKVRAESARLALQREGITLSTVRQQTLDTVRAKKAAAKAAAEEARASQQAAALKAAEVAVAQANKAAKEQEVAANKRLADSHRQTADAARRTLDLQQRIRGQVLSMIAAYVGLPAIVGQLNQVVKAYQSLEATQNRLGATFGNTERVNQEIDWLRRNADRLKTSFQVLSEEYGKFAVATKGTVLQGNETRRIFLSVAEAGRVNKLSTEQMSRVFLALTQMISKGKIQAEELRQQMGDALPGAMQILAAGMGKTTAELDKMMESGSVTIDNLSKFATELDKRFGDQLAKSLESVTSSMGDFSNASYQARLKFAEGGFIDALQKALDRLTEYLRSAEAASLINSLSAATGGLITTLSYLPQYIRPIIVLGTALIGLKLASMWVGVANSVSAARVAMAAGAVSMGQLTVAANGSRTAILAAAAATRSWSVLLTAAGGPAGIVIAGVTTMLGMWLTRTDDATEAMTKHREIVDKVKNAYDRADRSSANWAKNIADLKAGEAEKNLSEVKKVYEDLIRDMDRTSGMFRNTLNMPQMSTSPIAQENRKHVTELVKALDDLKAGQITLVEFRERVDAVERATKTKAIKEWAIQLLEMAEGAKTAEREVKEAELVLKSVTGTAEEASEAVGELNGTFGETGDVVAGATEKVKAYEKALNDLKKTIPALKVEAEKAEDYDALEKLTETLLADGPPTPETANLIAQARAAIEQKYTDQLISAMPGLSTGFYNRLIQVESGGDSKARAKTSSATGIGQFTEGTWLGLFDKVFPALANYDRAAKLALRTNDEMSRKILERLTQENQQSLARSGIAANDTTLYLAHFLGAGDAVKVLLANPNELAENIVKRESVEANRSVFKPGMTAGDLIAWSARKMGSSGGQGGVGSIRTADLLSSGRTQAETDAEAEEKRRLEAQDALVKKRQEANRQLDAEIAGLGMSATQQEIINELSKLGLDANSEEGRLLAEKITKKNQERDLQQEITNLQAQQSSLQQQITFATQQGDTSTAEALKTQLADVNAKLAEAVQKAIGFWTAMGGPNADAAIAKLKAVSTQTENLGRKFLMTGQQMDEAIAGMGSDALMGFAQDIAEGENALDALGNAFRKFASDFLMQIAKMIMQQAIFNAMQSMGVGGGIMGMVSSLFHEGGVAGQPTQGRIANPAWFAGATKYHTGGVAGLAPNEVPAILEKGETIRTEEQEAALQNQLANGGKNSGQPIVKVINAFDAGSFVSEGLSSAEGEQSMLNWVRSNSSAINGALGRG